MKQTIDSSIGFLRDKLAILDSDLEKKLDNLLANSFGLLVTFLSNELTAQQRQIWLTLAQHYPDPKSGSELASKISKSIYKSIEVLKNKDLITVHEPHPRTFSIQANPNHPLTRMLIDYCTYYGNKE